MELTKLTHSHNTLLKREDATYRLAYDGATPSRLDVVAAIAKKEKGTVIVRHVHTLTGQQAATVHASVYTDEKIATAVEQAKLIAKQSKPVAVEAPAEA